MVGLSIGISSVVFWRLQSKPRLNLFVTLCVPHTHRTFATIDKACSFASLLCRQQEQKTNCEMAGKDGLC